MRRWLARVLLLSVMFVSASVEAFAALEITTQKVTVAAGAPYSVQLTATGGVEPYTWSISSGSLLSGLTLDTNGTIAGTTTATGNYSISFKVTDSVGDSDTTPNIPLQSAYPLTITTQALAYGYVGSTYYRVTLPGGEVLPDSVQVSGGITPLSAISYTGTLPPGLSFNAGTISGTPSQAGEYNLDFSVTDGSYPNPVTATKNLPIRIYDKVVIATTTLTDALQKAAYSAALSGTGGVAPYTWSVKSGSLPAGLTLGTGGGISGTPTACEASSGGTSTFTATMTDSSPLPVSVDSQQLTLKVNCSNDYRISGNAGVAGATISYTGSVSGSVTADGDGNYGIGPLTNGTYTVRPSKTGYLFTPRYNSVTVYNADKTSSFVAAPDNPPSVTAFTLPETTTSLNVTVSTFTAEDDSGSIGGYLITESDSVPSASATGWKTSKWSSFTFAGGIPDATPTQRTAYAWVKDAAGNVSQGFPATTTIILNDTTKPAVSYDFSIPATSSSLTVAVTGFSATDNVGVVGYLLTTSSTIPSVSAAWTGTPPTSYTFSGLKVGVASTKYLFAWAKDAAGNISTYRGDSVIITWVDTVKPQTTSFTMPATATALAVPVTTFTATDDDAVSGYLITESSTAPSLSAAWSSTPPASYTFSAGGTRTAYAWTRDASGNVSDALTATVSITVLTDGACGSSNGKSLLTEPTTGLCQSGVAGSVTGTGPWSWSCAGEYGGTTATCSATKGVVKTGDCDSNNSVTISEVQSAINMYLGMKTVEQCVDQDSSGTASIAEVQKAINSFLGL